MTVASATATAGARCTPPTSLAALGYGRISVVEFGVAGGSGIVALERAAEWATTCFGVEVDVVGFDSGQGMAPTGDPRDCRTSGGGARS